MKRGRIRVALAAGALSLSLAIAGCGQQATTTTTESAVEQKDPAEKFVGEWQLAYIEAEGITIGGDLKAIEETTGEALDMRMSLTADGKGVVTLAGAVDASSHFTWALEDDNTVIITAEDTEAAAEAPDLANARLIYRDGEIGAQSMGGTDDTSSVEDVLSTGTLFFTADGTSDKANVPDVGAATDISSADALVGEWKIAGYGMDGWVVTCEAGSEILRDALGDTLMTMSFKDDGTCALFGGESTWEIKDGKALIASTEEPFAIKQVEDYLMFDLAAALGEGGSMFVLYAK